MLLPYSGTTLSPSTYVQRRGDAPLGEDLSEFACYRSPRRRAGNFEQSAEALVQKHRAPTVR